MTRKAKKYYSRGISILIFLVIIAIIGMFTIKTYQDYKLEKEDKQIADELERLLKDDLTLYEEVIPEGEESNGGIVVLPATNEDLLIANISYFGIVEIPRLGIRKPIVNGTTRKDIANKVGYDTHTGIPGQVGNVVLAAHNANNFFGRIYQLRNGDEIKITTRDGAFTYRVFDVFKVHKSEIWVYNSVDGHDKITTLITCVYPDANYRWIVRGELVEN